MNTGYFSKIFTSTGKWLITLIFLITLYACSSGGGNTPGTELSETEQSGDLGPAMKNVQITAGVPFEYKFTYTIPGDLTSKGDVTINLARTLQNVTLSSSPVAENPFWDTVTLLAQALIKSAYAQNVETAMITAYISYPGDPNVCSSAQRYGPYSISGVVGAALSGDTDSVTPTERTIDIFNQGSAEVCIVTTPPVSAYVSINAIEVDIEPCATPTVQIADTRWSGTYSCVNFGTPNDSGSITLDITQKPDGSYHYSDGDAEYDGHLCGNVFRFNGGGISGAYTESGTLRFNSDSTATKTSSWNSETLVAAGGDCSDNLTKTVSGEGILPSTGFM